MPATVESVWKEFDVGLRGFVARRVTDEHAAEDVLQDVYLKIHSRIDTLHNEESLRGWVYEVARNAVTDYYRGRKATAELPELPYTPADPIEARAAEALLASVRGMIECLSPADREALLLTEYEGLTQRELAERLGISVPGAKSRVQRARARLKALLLACCHFELDRAGRVMNYYSRDRECCRDGECGG